MGLTLGINYVSNTELETIVRESFNKEHKNIKVCNVRVVTYPDLDLVIRISTDTETIARFSFSPFIHNPCVAISNDTYVYQGWENLGVATALQKVKEDVAKAFGISLLLSTVRSDHDIQKSILRKSGWRPAAKFPMLSNVNEGQHFDKMNLWVKNIEQ